MQNKTFSIYSNYIILFHTEWENKMNGSKKI